MLRPLCVLIGLLAIAPAACACDCDAGGCQCSGGCACGSTTPPAPTSPPPQEPGSNVTVNIAVANFSFTPDDVTIYEGDTIQWDFVGGTHNAKSVFGSIDPFDTGFFSSGSASRTFLVPGTFAYYCVPHGFDNFNGTAGGMAGTITVLPAPEPGTFALGLIAPATLMLRRRQRKASH